VTKSGSSHSARFGLKKVRSSQTFGSEMKIVTYLLFVVLCFPIAAPAQSSGLRLPVVEASSGKTVVFSPVDRSLLTEYRILGRDDVPLVVAAEPSRTAEVAKAIESAGGHVMSQRDDIGYLYVQVPLRKLENVMSIAGIDAMQVACNPVRGEATYKSERKQPPSRGIPPSPFLPVENPYTGEHATQASTFKALHPTFDGRGVVIAFTEATDPATPSMQGALDVHGMQRAKFGMYSWGTPDFVGDAEGIEDQNSYYSYFYWQQTATVTPKSNGQVTFNEHTYKLPESVDAEEWRLCMRREPESWLLSDKSSYVVLWAVDQHRLWMMEENQKDFAKAHMAEVTEPWFVVHIHDFVPGAERQSLNWVFNVDVGRRMLGFGPTTVKHGAMVASVMAGNSFLGSKAGGVAPAAQLEMFSSGRRGETPELDQMNDFLHAFQSPATDIIQSSTVVGDSWRLRGDGAYTRLVARLSRVTGKPFVEAAGNAGADWDTIYALAGADEVFTIGGFTPRETLRVNFGYEPLEDLPVGYSSYGPTADGGLKPDFLALTGTVSESEYGSGYWDSPFGLYGPSGGTSAASPNAAGLLALLVSAAKQTGVRYDVARLRAALATTARFLPGEEARAQGYGLIQINDAWTALQRANQWEPSRFVTEAAVVNAEGITERTDGRGLFEMSGWMPGSIGQRQITVTRIGGPADAEIYRLKWKGSVDVFSSPINEVALPLNQPVRIPIVIRAGNVGSYSAILDFIDPRADLIAHSVMATIFVAVPLTPASDYKATLVKDSTRSRVQMYLNVPAGLSGMMVHLKRDDGKGAVFKAQDPTGRILPYNLYGSASKPEPPSATVKGEQVQYFDHPASGVWQFAVGLDDMEAKLEGEDSPRDAKFSLQFTGYQIDALSVSKVGTTQPQTVTFANKTGAGLKTHVTGLGLGSEHETSLVLQPGLAASLFEVEVAEGAKRLEISSEHGDPESWVGLYVYKAPDGPNKAFGDPKAFGDATPLLYEDSSHATEKHWVLDSPSPGRYIIAVDSLHVPASGLKIHYRDVVIQPAFGDMSCMSSEDAITPNARLSAQMSWAVQARPVGERKLVAECALTSPEVGYSNTTEQKDSVQENKPQIVPVVLATQTIPVEP